MMYSNEAMVEPINKTNQQSDTIVEQPQPLRNYVEQALQHYFEYLGNEETVNLYALVISEVEIPLLKAVLKRTNGNQSKAAQILGINRGTLRKKLKEYNLE